MRVGARVRVRGGTKTRKNLSGKHIGTKTGEGGGDTSIVIRIIKKRFAIKYSVAQGGVIYFGW